MSTPRPSPELLAVARRWYEAIAERDPKRVQAFFSKSETAGFVGSAEGETWFGPAVRRAVGEHFLEIPDIVSGKEISGRAFENGDTGWSFFEMEYHFENRPAPIRFYSSLIFVLEDESWKIVFRQTSVPNLNQEVTGHEHAAIQALVEAAQQGFSLDQREGLASVMFTDVVGSSTLAAAMGDRAWSDIVTRHFADIRQIVEAQGGQFVKSLGDGTMSSFPSARAALTAAQQIQHAMSEQTSEPQLSIRIGVHTGDVVQSDDDFFGTVVNKAARITAAASPGTVLVSDVTRAMVGHGSDVAFSDPNVIALKGLEGEHTLFRMI